MLARVSLKADTKATAKNIFVTTENLFRYEKFLHWQNSKLNLNNIQEGNGIESIDLFMDKSSKFRIFFCLTFMN